MKKHKTKIKYGVLITVFIAIFLHFFFNNRFYVPSELTIQSSATESTTAKLYWDSGSGFNERESYAFVPYEIKKFEKKLHDIEITRLTDVNPESDASEVWIDSIILDGMNSIDLKNAVVPGESHINDSGKLVLDKPDVTIKISETFEKLDIVFFHHQWAGKALISIDGKKYTEDLYSANTVSKQVSYDNGALPGTVENKFALPQLDITALKWVFANESVTVDDVTLVSGNGTVAMPIPESSINGTTIFMDSVNLNTASFHAYLMIVQLLTAAVITVALFYLWSYLERVRKSNLKNTLAYIFIGERRWFFWVLFVLSTAVFSLWLLGQWPGVMTVDSYHFTWREIKTLQFENVTPWIYNLYVLALTQLYDSPVVVGMFQILITSLLGSLILYFCYKKEANKWIVFACAVLFITSIPVGVYNITMWKDIPFSTLMLFWGFIIFYFYYKKRYEGTQVNLNVFQLGMFAILFFLVCTLRQNGLVLVVAIPAILFFFKLFTRKNFWQFSVASCIIFLIYYIVTPMIAINTVGEVSSFFSKTYKVSPLSAIYTSKHYYSPTAGDDKLLINRWMTDEELRQYYTPVMQADTVSYMMGKWSAMSPDDQSRLASLYITRSLQNPHIFLADRLSMTLGTMGLSSNVFITTNALRDAEVDKSAWRPIEAYHLTNSTKSKWLEKIENKIIQTSTWYTGDFPIPFLIFNTLPAFLILAVVLCFFRKIPGAALYSTLFLYNMPFLFVALSTAEWRYFYFILLAVYFVFPIISMEYRSNKKLQQPSLTSA
ncbi:hypothetical protein [Cohnella sp. WQ 127256]|uniref:hypothetical protein n=1 Tax=Cohnella sp. WQ 127256 TaxID=2938790 RepID=UPI002119A958|nr:hypothetical protein [Cohnella sp. WQ 127256]